MPTLSDRWKVILKETVLISLMVVGVLFLSAGLYYVGIIYFNITDTSFLSIIVGVAGATLVGMITGQYVARATVEETFSRNKRLNLNKYLEKLKIEIRFNIKKIAKFREDLEIYSNFLRNLQNEGEKWLPKCPSIRPYSGFAYQYLPANSYHYIITVEDFNLDSSDMEKLILFYYNCIRFSDLTQYIEVELDDLKRNRRDDPELVPKMTRKFGQMRELYDLYKPKIQSAYENLPEAYKLPLNTGDIIDPNGNYICP